LLKRLLFVLAPLALVAGAAIFSVDAADHRDSPTVEGDPAADITDVYAFRSPENDDNLVVALGVNGLTPPAEQRDFGQDVTYNIHVDNTGDLAADATASITFDGATFTVNGLGDPITGNVTPAGASAPVVNEVDGIKAFAGPRDDAFFFDLTGFKEFVAGPYVPASGLRPAGETPADMFAGTNVSYIVLELPITALTGAASSDTGSIKAWATTNRGAQVDRMAIPAINTALIPSDMKNAFNQADPANDEATYRPVGQSTIEALRGAVDPVFGSDQDGGPLGDLTPEQVATALIPDVVTIDFSMPVQFPNGRRLQDDVIDAALGVVLNRGGAAGISDAIDSNDVAFGAAFPFLAAPHQGTAPQAPPSSGTGFAQDDGGMNGTLWTAIGAALASVALIGGGLYLRTASAKSK
jgi:hypothetical protein